MGLGAISKSALEEEEEQSIEVEGTDGDRAIRGAGGVLRVILGGRPKVVARVVVVNRSQ